MPCSLLSSPWSRSVRTSAFALALATLLVALPSPAFAQITWTGSGDGSSWSDPQNWSSQTVPGTGDDVVIDATPGSTYTVQLTTARTVATLTLNSGDATLAADADLTVSGTHDHVLGRLTGTGTVTVQGAFRWENGTRSGSGTTVAQGGFTVPDGVTLDGRRLVLPTGTTGAFNTVDNFTGTDGAVLEIESGAAFDIQDFGNLSVGSNASSRPTIINRGTVQKTSDSRTTVEWALDNSGTVEADLSSTGTDHYLRFSGPLTDNGGTYRATNGRLGFHAPDSGMTFGSGSAIRADSSGTIRFGRSSSATADTTSVRVEGTYDVRGTTAVRGGNNFASVTIASGATLQDLGATALKVGGNRGILTVNTTDPLVVGRLRIRFGGHLRLQASLTVEGTYSQDFDPSTFSSDQQLTVQGALTWGGGTMAGSGTTVAQDGFTIQDGVTLDGRRLVLPTGTTGAFDAINNFTGTSGAVLEIRSGATFDIRQEGHLDVASDSSSPPTVLNRGTVKKTGDYRTNVEWALQNSGTVEAALSNTGPNRYLRFSGPLTDNGGTYRATNGRLGFHAPDSGMTFGSGSAIRADSSGTIRFGRSSSATADTTSVRVEGTYDVRGTTAVRGGNNFASVTIASGATLQDLGATALKVGGNRGILTVNTTNPLEVGRLRLAFGGHLQVQSDLRVAGRYNQAPSPSSFRSDHRLVVEGPLRWKGGLMAGNDTTLAKSGLRLPGGLGSASWTKRLKERHLIVPSGETAAYPGAYLSGKNGASLEIRSGAVFDIQGQGGLSVKSGSSSPPTVLNRGTLKKTGDYRTNVEWALQNSGTVEAALSNTGPNRYLRFSGPLMDNGGTYRATNGRLELSPTQDTLQLGPKTLVDVQSGGALQINEVLTTEGPVDVQGTLYSQLPLQMRGGAIDMTSGRVVLGGVNTSPTELDTVLWLRDGTLRGSGTVTGDVVSDSGLVRPGTDSTAARLDVVGTYKQRAGSQLDLELGGDQGGSGYDLLSADQVALAGTLRLDLINDYVPDSTDRLTPVRWTDSTQTGTFDDVRGQEAGPVFLAVQYAPAALEVYDGSLSSVPITRAPTPKVESTPFVRSGRDATVNFKVTNKSSSTVLTTFSPRGKGDAPDMHRSCPDDGSYQEFKCRLERFGVTPPPPPEGESYPDLGNETLFGGGSGSTQDLAPNGDVGVVPGGSDGGGGSGGGGGSSSSSASKSKECPAGGTLRAKLKSGSTFMSSAQLKMCSYDLAKLALNVVPGSDCFQLAKTIGTKVGTGFVEGQFDYEGYVMASVFDAADCASDFTPGKYVKLAGEVYSAYSAAGGIKSAVGSCLPPSNDSAPTRKTSTECIGSIDPNDKFGPPGAGTPQYTSKVDSLPYTVLFENKPDATAPAQTVVVDDTLDAGSFAASQFAFGPVAFGDTTIFVPDDTLAFSKDVDLRPEKDLIVRVEGSLNDTTGVINWTFTSLDPKTMQPPTDPTKGFLPPNDNPPEGEGSVSYYATLDEEVASGLRFGHAAEIVFDNNAPIKTDVWSNVLDIAPPTSRVDSLAPTQDSVSFRVRWRGADAESGVDEYTVYVAKDGGAFTQWIADTSATAAVYDGKRGGSYSFYSVATDSVGLVEPDSAAAEASTTIATDAIPVELTEMGATLKEEGRAVALTWKTASETGNAGFEVQRKAGPEAQFRRVGFVEGAGTTSEPQTYRFVDEDLPYAADTLRYRLRQVDTDGSAQVTDPTVVARGGPSELTLKETYPNPARNRVTVRYAIPESRRDEASEVTLRLYDVLGREVRAVRLPARAGRHERQVSVSGLASGVYILRLRAGGASQTRRLTVVK
ncbi:MAG: T9SS type A sorting domain-containing protein [Salinibacter sp.]